jgi:rhamnogalacturonan endolyase
MRRRWRDPGQHPKIPNVPMLFSAGARPEAGRAVARRRFLAGLAGGLAGLATGLRVPGAARAAAASRPFPRARLDEATAAAFGYTSSGGYYTVSTGAGLTFKIRQSDGDLTSLNLNGAELQDQSSFSQVESGLGSATVTAVQTGSYIVVTATTTSWYGSGTLHHYLVAVSGQNNIYMATYVGPGGGGELRWITRLNRSVITTMDTAADVDGGTPIESTDIDLVNGQTRSKYYSNRQARGLTVRGVTGSGIGVYMAYGNRESSSGGPFFRDIEQQGTSTEIQLYNYLWSGHNQTEAQRLGVLYGPYSLMVAGTSTPAAPDMSFMDQFGFAGQVPASGRGYVSGGGNGVTAGIQPTVGWANATAQYWATPQANGDFYSPAMKPGTYTQTLYQGELAVATRTVTVTAGTTATGQNLDSAWSTPASPVFRIGTWDGAPTGFRNWPNLTVMHPSDTRNTSWGPLTYTAGSTALSGFPAYQWKDVSSPATVQFSLTSAQIAARTVRIGITAAYAGGRPQITVNNWSSPGPAASSQPDSRSLTIGTYRGNNALYTFSVPASAFVTGTNTMKINVISGSAGLGGYLSPGVSYDCLEMY